MNDARQLMMEPRNEAKAVGEASGSAIKSILFVVHEDDGLEARLQAALSLARACSAHLQLLQVIPLEAYTVVDSYGGNFVSAEIVEALEDQAAKVRVQIETHLNKEDVSWSYEITTSPMLPELLKKAALSDLIVIGRKPHWREFSRTGPGLLGALVCSTHVPLCIPGDEATGFDPFGLAVIAWNGSIEGANAVRSSIGILRLASTVRVVRCAEKKELAFPDTAILEYLSRHGIHAELETLVSKGKIAGDLLDFAARAGARYLVMGGYSHSRAGEYMFGGVTHDLLRACPISLVMAH